MLTDQTQSFSGFDISEILIKTLTEASFEVPTAIQSACIPLGLERHDVIGCAQTGTGKTAAFFIPVITYLEKNPEEVAHIMAPTREIVYQIGDAARVFLKNLPEIRVSSIIGGANMDRQIKSLQKKPRLIVGTPGRLNDLIARRKLHLNTCHTLVLDEADRMLDMGFAPQIDTIIKCLPKNRQTLMFSATMAPSVEKLAKSYLQNPKFISSGQRETAPIALKQKVVVTTADKKDSLLMDELNARQGSVLIFAETKRRVEKLGYKLQDYGFNIEILHGGRSQGQRFRALKNFKEGEVNVLVATDVASRGLDIGNITHVINYDLPSNPEDFLHRVGRTARNGKDGEALTLATQADLYEFNRVKKYLGDCEVVGVFEKGASEQRKPGRRPFRAAGSGQGGGFRKGPRRGSSQGGASSAASAGPRKKRYGNLMAKKGYSKPSGGRATSRA